MEKMPSHAELRYMRRKLWWLGLTQFPLVGFLRPKLLYFDDSVMRVQIKLGRRSRNHLGSMYFGALTIGADLAGALHAFYFQKTMGVKLSFVFKSLQADFVWRAESNVTFECRQGHKIRAAILSSQKSGERIHLPVQVTARDSREKDVARFELTLSLKAQK